MQIKSFSKIDFDTLFKAFNQAFADYEIQLNNVQLQTMLKRRGFNPDLSFAAVENNEIVSFTLNGIGNFNGIPTAYDTGTGTLKAYRGKGLATKVFEYSIPFLQQANIKQYLLEVLQHNTKAISVYQNLGFETVREFNCFKQKNEEIHLELTTTDTPCSIRQIDSNEIYLFSDFCDFYPSWQNSFESVQRASADFVSLGAFFGNEMVGYSVFEPISGDITQIAVSQQYRRKGIATLLLNEIIKLNKYDSLKVLNTDVLHTSITDFLTAKNINLMVKQFEMIKQFR